MKLFLINWTDNNDDEYRLMVAENEEKIRERFEKEVFSQCACPMFYFVKEVKEVDGYKIMIS